jgi:hypothetical protein
LGFPGQVGRQPTLDVRKLDVNWWKGNSEGVGGSTRSESLESAQVVCGPERSYTILWHFIHQLEHTLVLDAFYTTITDAAWAFISYSGYNKHFVGLRSNFLVYTMLVHFLVIYQFPCTGTRSRTYTSIRLVRGSELRELSYVNAALVSYFILLSRTSRQLIWKVVGANKFHMIIIFTPN